MQNYTNALYHLISNRIAEYMNKNNLTSTQLSLDLNTDQGTISRIKNCKINKNKNRYLISPTLITELSSYFNKTIYQFIWGEKHERENFVKIILLSVMMNGSKLNPFVCFADNDNLDLFIWANKQKCLPDNIRAYVLTAISVLSKFKNANETTSISPSVFDGEKKCGNSISILELKLRVIKYFKSEYGFFFNTKNHTIYSLINNKEETIDEINNTDYDNQLNILSNLILSQVMYNYAFASSYINRVCNNIVNNNSNNTNRVIADIKKFLLNQGRYCDIALDFKEYDYCLFVNAFNQFWDKHRQKYMSYFNKKLFGNKNIEQYGLKFFKNKYFYMIITDNEFIKINSEANLIDEYTDTEAFLSKNYVRLKLANTIQINLFKDDELTKRSIHEAVSDYICNSAIELQNLAKKI